MHAYSVSSEWSVVSETLSPENLLTIHHSQLTVLVKGQL